MTAFPLGAAVTVAALEDDPHPLLAALRAREPVSWVPALGGWLVTRRDLALAAMRDPGTLTVDDPRFTTARVVGASMLSLDGAAHRRHRAPFAGPLRRAAVHERFTAPVDAVVAGLLDGLAGRGAAELRTALAAPVAAAVVAHALGLGDVDVAEVLGWYGAIVAAVTAATAGDPVPADGRAGFAALRAALLAEVDRDPRRSLLAAAAAPGGLTREEVVANAAVLLFGGIETTEGTIASALAHLLTHPAELARARDDPARVPAAVEESLRLEPAAATVDRYATAALELGGARIAPGDLVTISIAGANRDPAVFADPDRYDPDRPNAGRHISWAAGPHVCVGMHLARLETHAALAGALARLPGLRLDPAHPPPAARGLVFRKPATVRSVWDA